jgi:hypothetical protein
VLRGKYVMEVILGTPPPPPPPGVPTLDQTAETGGENQVLTTRQRMEIHRAAPVCRACHNFMDPNRPVARQLRRDRQVADARERRRAGHAR